MSDIVTPKQLRFERTLDAPIETVWRWIVEPELRAKWFMGGKTDLRVGGEFELTMKHDDLSDDDVPTPEPYAEYVGKSWSERITRIEPPRLIAFSWENGEAGEVTIELTPAGDRTRLVLTHEGLRGRDDAKDFGGGWHSHLAALEERIAGRGVPDFWALHAQSEKAIASALEG